MPLALSPLRLLFIGITIGASSSLPLNASFEIDTACLNARRAVRSGRFAIRTDNFMERFGKRVGESHNEYIFYIDGDRWREDYTENGITAIAARGEQYYFQYVRDTKIKSGLVAKELNSINFGDPEYRHINPTTLMFFAAPLEVTNIFPIDILVGSSNRHDISCIREPSGQWRVSCLWTAPDNTHWNVRYWIDPSRGSNLTRIEEDCTDDNPELAHANIACELRHISGDIWFPERIHFEQRGSNQSMVEDLTIVASQINQNVASSVFGPAEMSIPPETVVARVPKLPNHQGMKWDGKALVVTAAGERSRLGVGGQTRGERLRIALVIISSAFALVGVWMIGRGVWRRKRGHVT